MKKKLIIDEKICLKHKMTLNEVLIALAVRTEKIEDNLENMVAREILVNNSCYQITQHWSDVVDEILCDSSKDCEKSDEELLSLAKKMREVYPEGKMKDKFGRMTAYYYRCNNLEVSKALKRFFTQFGSDYSDEEIIGATKRYVASFNGNYNGQLRLLKYFILKNPVKQDEDGQGHVEQVSDLLTFLENGESEGVEITNSDDWLMNSRN